MSRKSEKHFVLVIVLKNQKAEREGPPCGDYSETLPYKGCCYVFTHSIDAPRTKLAYPCKADGHSEGGGVAVASPRASCFADISTVQPLNDCPAMER